MRRGRVSLPGHIYNVAATTISRYPYFSDFHAACAASACFERRDLLADAQMLAWVLMPDHAHWLIWLGGDTTLHEVTKRLKSASARAANRALGREGNLWARAYHDRALRMEEDVVTAARYIIANPLRAGLVHRAGDYPFWNAMWL